MTPRTERYFQLGFAIIFGLAALAGITLAVDYWKTCWQGDDFWACYWTQEPDAVSAAMWAPGATVLVFGVAALALLPGWRPILMLAAGLVAMSRVADPGFFWQGWDTAMVVPGTGVISHVLVLVAAVVFATPVHRTPVRIEREPVRIL